MTTITIKSGLKKSNYTFNTPLQAIEDMFAEMGMVMLQPIENQEILERTEKHFKQNKDRAIDSYDDI
ncbi:hypothetical protein [Mariniflexile sp.]|uniref:hypothetical protein n=1 Tax=Mariniflexile sp. TaxID=1979402 RepID=UPI004047FB8F